MHWNVMELLLTLQNYPLLPSSYLVKSVTAWWKFDLRFVFGCRGIQGRTPGKWVGERWCLYYFCLPLLLLLPLLCPLPFLFFYFFQKQPQADLFQIHWPNVLYLEESSRKLPRKPGHFCSFRKPKPFVFGDSPVWGFLLVSHCVVVMGPTAGCLGKEINPCRLGRGWGRILIIGCLENLAIQSFLEKNLWNCHRPLLFFAIFLPILMPYWAKTS